MKPTATKPTAPALLTTLGLAEFLNLSPRTIQGMRRRGQLPPSVRLGTRSVRWRREDIEKWLNELH